MQKQKNHKKTINPGQNTITLFLTYIFIFSLIILPGQKINAQSEIQKDDQLLDLQKKLNELNASLAQANKKQETDVNNPKPDVKEKKDSALIDNNSNIAAKDKNNQNKQDQEKEKKDVKQKNTTLTTEKPKKEKDEIKDTISTPEKKDDEKYKKEKKKADWIIRTIDNGAHKDRKEAINHILTIKDADLKKQLGHKINEIIQDEIDLEVKVKAITVAGEIKNKESVPYLIKSLDSESKDVILAAIYAIKRIEDHSTKPVLIEKLKQQKLDANSNIIEALIDTLGEFKAVELITFAKEAIKDIKTNQIIRELLVLFLGKLDSKDSKNILSEILKDEDESVQIRAFAANSLANLGIKEAGNDIEKVIKTIESYSFNKKKKYYNLYIYSVAALAKLGDEKAIPRLINALRSDNAVVRLKAIELIKELKDKRTIDILKYKKDYDPSPKVQKAAKEALIELGIESGDSKDAKKEESDIPDNELSDID